MELETYKVCPTCGKHCAISTLECEECDTDLTGVPVTRADQAQEEAHQTEAPKPAQKPGMQQLVRVCSECGMENAPQARKCSQCGEDISDIQPTPSRGKQDDAASEPEQEFQTPHQFQLCSVDGDYTFDLSAAEMILGRSLGMKDYLSGKRYVSRRQVRVYQDGCTVQVENLSETNPTFINNVPVEDGRRVTLNIGDELGLGGIALHGQRQDQAAYFVLRVKA